MRLTRRHLLLSALALGVGPPLPGPTRVAPDPDPSDPAATGSGLAALAVRVAPLDWRDVFTGDDATAGFGHGSRAE